MELIFSEIQLNIPEKVRIDESGRSVGFFCRRLPVRIDGKLIQELIDESERRGGSNVRICLHDGPEALFHDMIILEHKGNKYYRPHMHPGKGDCMHIIEGSLAVFSFDDEGEL